jgi:hypothetical protein
MMRAQAVENCQVPTRSPPQGSTIDGHCGGAPSIFVGAPFFAELQERTRIANKMGNRFLIGVSKISYVVVSND